MDKTFKWLPEAPNAEEWFNHLTSAGHLSDGQKSDQISQAIVQEVSRVRVETPLYLRALSGIGAIISGFLLLFLLYLLGLFDTEWPSLTFNGLLLMGIASFCYRSGLKTEGLSQDFLIQVALTLLQAGKVSLVIGLGFFAHDTLGLDWAWPVALILAGVAALSYALFPSSLERFVAALSALIAIWVCMLIDGPDRWQGAFFALLILAHLIVVAGFLRWNIWRVKLTSLYDAILVSLCIGVGIIASFVNLASVGEVSDMMSEMSIGLAGFSQKWPTQIVMTCALLGLVVWIAGRHHREMGEAVWAALAGILLLGFIADPGILLALGLLALGYATHRPPHILLGLVFSILFGYQFYYALDLTLLQKSGILLASGLVLLAAAFFIHWRKWSYETAESDISVERGDL